MKLAYSTNAYMRWPMDEAIQRVAALGYRGVEIMADRPHAWPADMNGEQLSAIKSRVDDLGLTISNVNAFMMNAVEDFWHPSWIEPDAAYRRLRIEHTMRALAMAQSIGATCITTEPGGPIPKGVAREAAVDLFVTGLQEVLRCAEDEQVMLLVEPEPGLLIENVDQFIELTKRIDSPMFGLNFDIGHMYCVGEDVPAAVKRLERWTCHYHIEDIAASRVHEHLIPGKGAIDFAAVLGAIGATGFQAWMTVELYPYLSDPDAAGREALDYLQRLSES